MYESSFDIRSPKDFWYEMVIPQYEDFKEKNSSSRHALLTIILLYHMYEWVNEHTFSKDHFRSIYKDEEEMAEIFDLARNISNGTKHFEPRARAKTQTGFSSAFSDDFARPLNVVFPDGKEESADIFIRKMVEFWSDLEKEGAF